MSTPTPDKKSTSTVAIAWVIVLPLLAIAIVVAIFGWLNVRDLEHRLTAQGLTLGAANDRVNALDEDRKVLAAGIAAKEAKFTEERDLLLSQLVAANHELDAATEQLRKTSAALAQRSRLPCTVVFRRAILGPGMIGSFTNDSSKTLSVAAEFTNPTLHKAKQMAMILKPHEEVQIGALQGWAFASGDSITLHNANYEPINATAP